MSKRYATDSNQYSISGYHVFNWRASYRHKDRYYELVPRRNWLAGVGVEYRWD